MEVDSCATFSLFSHAPQATLAEATPLSPSSSSMNIDSDSPLLPSHAIFPASHFSSLPTKGQLSNSPLASPALPFDTSRLLPSLRAPLLGTLIDARHQVLLLASHALASPSAQGLGGGNANHYLYSHLALSCQEALERVNEWLREPDGVGGWGVGAPAEELRAGVIRLLDLEFFLIRQHITTQSSLTSPTLQRLWEFYDTLRLFTSRRIQKSTCTPPAISARLIMSLPEGTMLHAQDTPLTTIRALVHACLLEPALLEAAKRKGLGVCVKGWETEQPEDVELGLRRLGLGGLVREGKAAAKGLGEGEGRRELSTPGSPVTAVFGV